VLFPNEENIRKSLHCSELRNNYTWENTRYKNLEHHYQVGFNGWIGRIKLQGNHLLTCGFPDPNHYGVVIYKTHHLSDKECLNFLHNQKVVSADILGNYVVAVTQSDLYFLDTNRCSSLDSPNSEPIKKEKAHAGALLHTVLLHNAKIYTCSTDTRIWDMETFQNESLIPDCTVASCIEASPKSSLLALGSYNSSVMVFDSITRKKSYNLTEHQQYITGVSWMPNNLLVSCSADETVKMWDLRTPSKSLKTIKHNHQVTAVATTHNYLFSSSVDSTIKQWNANNNSDMIHEWKLGGMVANISVLEDKLASIAHDKTVKIWKGEIKSYDF